MIKVDTEIASLVNGGNGEFPYSVFALLLVVIPSFFLEEDFLWSFEITSLCTKYNNSFDFSLMGYGREEEETGFLLS